MYAVDMTETEADQELIEYRKAEIAKTIKEIDEGRCKLSSFEDFERKYDEFFKTLEKKYADQNN